MNTKEYSIYNRRYIGSKLKLSNWIFDLIDNKTTNVNIFVDIFAGTGIIGNNALPKYKKVIFNDFLYSNHVIYKGFYLNESWNDKKISSKLNYYNNIDPKSLEPNYFSNSYADKYYDLETCKIIGFIREDIKKSDLNEKEEAILLASLIYSMDLCSNTVGHFDAYIKKPITKKEQFKVKLINSKREKKVKIYRMDSNKLARKIKSDLVYIDPPYNSRQYSRFYHVYENLVKWEKPKLYGVACKPEPDNVSDYCKVKAKDAFLDLVTNLDTKYLAVSYNNTYKSKSKSSENKIKLEEITEILNTIGKTEVFEQSHKFFSAGKTDFSDHKEFLFLTKK